LNDDTMPSHGHAMVLHGITTPFYRDAMVLHRHAIEPSGHAMTLHGDSMTCARQTWRQSGVF